MLKEVQTVLDRINEGRSRYKKWQQIVAVLGFITVFCTTYALILPAITLESSPDAICGMEEHTHTSDCYERRPVLICDNTDPDHEHTDECYRMESVLICGKEEHKHNASCFPKEEPKEEEVVVEPENPTTAAKDAAEVSEPSELKTSEETTVAEETQASETQASETQTSETQATETQASEETTVTEETQATEADTVETRSTENVEYAKENFPVMRSMTHVAKFKKAAPAARENDLEGLETDKTIVGPDSNGIYKITMEAFVSGNETITVTTSTAPVDVILVLDQSKSMDQDMKKWQYKESTKIGNKMKSNAAIFAGNGLDPSEYKGIFLKRKSDNEYIEINVSKSGRTYTYTLASDPSVVILTSSGTNPTFPSEYENVVYFYALANSGQSRMDVLKDAAQTFVNLVSNNAKGADGTYGTADDIKHRIAVVGFSNSSGNGTEIILNGSRKTYPTAAEGVYGSALVYVNTEAGYNSVTSSVGKLHTVLYTYSNKGLEMAKGIFENTPKEEGRSRIVVFMTDGVPGERVDWKPLAATVADSAISHANTLKNSCDATVYAIGVFGGADAKNAGEDWTSSTNAGDEKESAKYANRFMQRVSSNNGSVKDPSYYLVPSDASELAGIFKEIANAVASGGAAAQLNSTTTVVDIVSDFFDLPEGADASSIKVYTENCTGVNSSNEPTFSGTRVAYDKPATITGKKVSVTGFDFTDNWCGVIQKTGEPDVAHGKKLIIEVPVVVEEDFIGGFDVPGNDKNSGVYVNGKVVENFPPTAIDVPPSLDIVSNDQTVYVNSTDNAITKLYPDIAKIRRMKNFVEDHNAAGLTSTKYEFTIPDGDTFATGASGRYSMAVKITNTRDNVVAVDKSAEAKVYVLVPQVTFNDTLRRDTFFGMPYDNAKCLSFNIDSTKWVPDNGWDVSKAPKVSGDPTYDISKEKLTATFKDTTNKNKEINGDYTMFPMDVAVDVTGMKADGKEIMEFTKFAWKHNDASSPCVDHGTLKVIATHDANEANVDEFYLHCTSGVELPSTGGSGVKNWFIVGMSLMTTPIMIGLSIKRKRSLIKVF